MNIQCPHCNARHALTDATSQTSAQCPSCKQRFPVTEQRSTPEPDADDAFPPVLMAFCIVAGLVVLALVLALATSPNTSAVIVLSLGLAILAYWKREGIQRYLAARKQRAVERRKAKEQAAAEAESRTASEATDSTNSSRTSDDAVTAGTTAEAAANAPEMIQPTASGPWNVPPTTPEFFEEPAREVTQPENAALQQPSLPETVADNPKAPATATQPSAIPEEQPSQAEASEPEPLTAGLPEKYQPFLSAAMTQSKWSLRDLEAMARMHHLRWDDVVSAINEWSQERFKDPMLVQDDEEVWVQLPLI